MQREQTTDTHIPKKIILLDSITLCGSIAECDVDIQLWEHWGNIIVASKYSKHIGQRRSWSSSCEGDDVTELLRVNWKKRAPYNYTYLERLELPVAGLRQLASRHLLHQQIEIHTTASGIVPRLIPPEEVNSRQTPAKLPPKFRVHKLLIQRCCERLATPTFFPRVCICSTGSLITRTMEDFQREPW